jgi:undecaprenyl pyrophosphate phosphatase UppP
LPVWYGGFTNAASGVSLTDNQTLPLTAPNKTAKLGFELTQEAGRAVSFNDFNEFRLFLVGLNQLLAKAVIPGVNGTSATNITTSTIGITSVKPTATSSATAAPTASPTGAAQKSGAENKLAGGLGLALLALVTFF